jgi:hypothetical protein
LVASSTLSVPVVGVVGEAAVSVASSTNGCVVGCGEGEEGGFANVDWTSKAGSDWTMSKPRELGGGSGLAMPSDVGRGQELEGRSDYGIKRVRKQTHGQNSGARHDER